MRLAAGLAAALALGLAAPATALAHATVESTSPSRGAALAKEPERVVFRFSESVETQFGAVRVFDARGRRVDRGATSQPTAASAAVRLRPGLADGAYTATYNIVSADSHPVSGGFSFTIGRAGGKPAAAVDTLIGDTGSGPVTTTAFAVTKAIAYGATALLAGGALFLWLAWPAGLCVPARGRALGLAAAGLGLVATAAGIVLQGATASGTSFWSALDPSVVHDVLATGFGSAWAVRLAGFAALVAVLAPPPSRVPLRHPPAAVVAVTMPALAVLLVTPALSGHADATDPRTLMLAGDALHVAAMSAWVGGVAVMTIVLPAAVGTLAPGERTRVLAGIVARFSAIALASVGALLATGVLQSVVHLRSFGELLSSGYGRAIAVKAVIVVVLIGAGAVNRRRTLPRLRAAATAGDSPGRAGLSLRRVIRGELALMALAIAVTAALVGYAPPATSAAGPVSVNRDLGPARLEMTVSPARTGTNEIHLYLFDRRSGAQYDRPREVTVTASQPGRRIGPLTLRTRKTGPGHYTIPAADLVPGGTWRIEVDARVSDFDQYTATVRVPIR